MKNNIIKISIPLILIFSLMVSFSGCNEKDTDNKSKTYKTVVNDNSEKNTISESEKDTQSNFVDTSSASSSGKQLVASNSASSNNKNEIKSSKSQIKSVVFSSKQTTSAKVNSTNQRQEYSDYFVCDYTIYIKDEYLSQKFTASDFTKLATKDLTGGNKIFHLLANYTEKNEIIETLKSSMARKEVDKVTCEYVAYRVKTGEKNPVLPSIERKEIGSIEKKDLHMDGVLQVKFNADGLTVFSVADFSELSLDAVSGLLSADNNYTYLQMYLTTLGDEARINAAEKIKNHKNVVSVETYSMIDYDD